MTESGTPPRDLGRWLWTFLVALQLFQIWFGSQFPSQDGAVHVYIASLLQGASEAQADWFVSNPYLEPNLSVHYALAGFLAMGLDAIDAERLLLSLYVFVFALGARSFVRVLGGSWGDSLLLLPFALGYFVHAGYYNFCWGSALCLVTLAVWLRDPVETSRRRLLVLLGLFCLLVVTHLFWLLFTLLSIGLLRTGMIATRKVAQPLRAFGRDAAYLLGAALPTMYLVWSFVGRHELEPTTDAVHPGVARLAFELASGQPLYALSKLEVWVHVPFLALLAVLVAIRGWRLLRGDRSHLEFMFALAAVLVLYFADPMTTQDIAIWQRLVLPIYMLLVGWLSGMPLGRLRPWLAAVMAVVLLVAAGVRLTSYQRVQVWLDRYLAAAAPISKGSSVLPLHLWDRFQDVGGVRLSWRVDPFAHVSARAATHRQAIDMRSSLMSPSLYGHFPIVYRADRDPYRTLGPDIETNAARIDLGALGREGLAPDWVLLFDPRSFVPTPPAGSPLAQSLVERGYEKHEPPAATPGFALWRRR